MLNPDSWLRRNQQENGDSMMTLLSTNDPSKDIVICPDKRSNIARFINGINNHTPYVSLPSTTCGFLEVTMISLMLILWFCGQTLDLSQLHIIN